MADSYLVELKPSVFRETPLSRVDFEFDSEDAPRLSFDSETDAETWVIELNREHPITGQLTLHTAHPDDASNVDAYLVFHPTQGVWISEER